MLCRWYAKRFLHPDIVSAYEYIFIWDEDLGVEHFNADKYYFHLSSLLKFDIYATFSLINWLYSIPQVYSFSEKIWFGDLSTWSWA